MELEGLRGLAAVMVALGHFAFLFYPALRGGDMTLAHTRFEDNIYGTPLMLPIAATLAVAIFFVLSGFVLSIGFFQTKDTNIVKKLATGRYLRLMLPALASVIIAFVLISFGSHSLTKAAGEIAKSEYLSVKWSHSPNLLEAVHTGTVDIFVNDARPAINNVLWTMHTEFIGSFLVFGFLLLFAASKYRWIAYTLLTVGTFGTWYIGFVIGMAIADAYAHGLLEKLKRKSILIPLAVGAFILAPYPKTANGTFYEYLELPMFDIKWRVFYLIIAATLILLTVLLSKRLTDWLQKPALSALGKYTFSLYLTHLFVIYTVSSGVVIALHDVVGYNGAVLVAALVSLPVFWSVTYLFERYIDMPSIRFAKYVGAIFRGEKEVEWKNVQALVSKVRKTFRRRADPLELDKSIE